MISVKSRDLCRGRGPGPQGRRPQAAEAAEAEEPAAEELKETDKSAGAEKTAGAEQVLAGTGAGNTAEREPEPERASAGAGADVLLFGVTAPTLETADGSFRQNCSRTADT